MLVGQTKLFCVKEINIGCANYSKCDAIVENMVATSIINLDGLLGYQRVYEKTATTATSTGNGKIIQMRMCMLR